MLSEPPVQYLMMKLSRIGRGLNPIFASKKPQCLNTSDSKPITRAGPS